MINASRLNFKHSSILAFGERPRLKQGPFKVKSDAQVSMKLYSYAISLLSGSTHELDAVYFTWVKI